MTGWIQNLPQLSMAATILWKITLLLAVGWAFHFLLLRRNPRWRVLLWRGVIVGSLLLPAIEIIGPRLKVEVPHPEPVVVEFADIPSDAVPRIGPARPYPMRDIGRAVETPEPTFLDRVRANLGPLFLVAWGVIALVLAARIITVWLQVRRIIKSSSRAPNPLVRLVQQIAAELGCRRSIHLRMTSILSSPFLTGILRALIIIPKRLLERPYFTELPAVLAHEVAHLRTNDLVWIFLAKTFGTIFWFHPLAWKIPSAHSSACEEICDAVAAEYVGGTHKYSGMLARFALELLADAPAHGGAAMISASRILKRLHVLKRGISAASLAKRWVILTVTTGLIILAGLGSVKLIYAERQEKKSGTGSSVSDSDSGKETTMSRSQNVRHEGNRVWIEGVPAVEWGQGKGCTYTGAFEAAASVTPNPWSYSDLMGVSGLAFRVRWCNNEKMGWCPSTPVGELPEEQILIDKATGWRQDTQVQFGDPDFDKGPIMRRIVESVDRGVPVLIYPSNYNIAVAYGYENGGERLLVRDYMADFYEDKESIVLPAEDLGPMQVYLRPGGDPLPPRERLIQGLRVAARNWHREHGDGGVEGRDYWYGAAAYGQWIADLEKLESLDLNEEKAGQFFHLNWWNFTSLVDARNSVGFFLRENADALSEEAREALLRAATIYEEETEFLDQAHVNKDAFLGPWSDKSIDDWTADVRRRERNMLARAKEMEAAAIAEIEKALEVEGVEIDPLREARVNPGEFPGLRGADSVTLKGHNYQVAAVNPGRLAQVPLLVTGSAGPRGTADEYGGHADPLYNIHCELGPDQSLEKTDEDRQRHGKSWGQYWQELAEALFPKVNCFAYVAYANGKLAGYVRFFPGSASRLRCVPRQQQREHDDDVLLIGAGYVDSLGAEHNLDEELVRRVVEHARAEGYAKIRALGWSNIRVYAMWGESFPTSTYEAIGFRKAATIDISSQSGHTFEDMLAGSHGEAVQKLAQAAVDSGFTVDSANQLHIVEFNLQGGTAGSGEQGGVSGEIKPSLGAAGKVIPGMEETNWGGSFFRRQDSFMACLTEVLRAAGLDVTYADVMGLSGGAFKLTLAKDLSPSGVPGYSCVHPALRVFGYSAEIINLDEEENPGGRERARDAIVRSIDRGIPVPYMDGEHSLVVGYRNGGRVFVCKPYAGGTVGYVEMEELRGMFGPAWFVVILHPEGKPRDRRDAVVASLQEGVRLTRARRLTNEAGDSFVSGLAAYESWVSDLEHAEERELNPHGNAYCYAILLTSRAAAAEYLRNIAGRFEEGGEQLRSAADHYQRVSERLWSGRDCVVPPWETSWTPENRVKEIAIMKQNLADEAQAIAEIEKALAAEGVEIPAPAATTDLPKSAMLDGVPHGKGNSNSYARGLDIVLNYLGAKADYDTIMGDTGQAFIIMSEDGGPLIDGAVDVGWWPIAAWGIKLRIDFLGETAGRELRVIEGDPDAYHADAAAHFRKNFHEQVKLSIASGKPVLAEHDFCFVVEGYDEKEPPLLGNWSLRDEKETTRMEGYPWGLIVPGKEMEPMDRKQADLDAIRHAVALGRDSVEMNVPAYWSEWLTVEGRFTGQRSFELWARALRDTEHLGQARWHANMVHHLGINRTSAVDYLRAMAERHPENVAQHLKMAAGTYEKVLAEVGKADTGEAAMTSKAGREKLAKLVEQIAVLEAQAIDHLAQVLEEYEIEPPVATRKGVTSTMNARDLRGSVKREDDKVFIEGFEEKFWGREPATLNSVMYTYSLLMNHLGDESVTYDELMGVSGAAFRVQILEAEGDLVPGLWGPCPSSPHANCGFQCSTEARNAFGLEFAHYEAKAGDTEAERKRRAAIIQSIDRGIPALYEERENDLIVGYFPDDESKYLRRCYGAKNEGYVELTDWGWGYAEVLTEWGEPRPERENHLNSLKLAVRLAYSGRFGGYLSGLNAYEYWIAGLENDEGYAKCDKDPMPWGNAWCFESLIDARAAAARYLRSIKGEFKEETTAHLEKAADLYEQISTTLAAWQKKAPNLWELNTKEKWTKEFRASEATVLKTAMDLERKAVAEIEKALLAEGMDVGAMHAEAARVATDENPIGEGGNTMKKLEGLKWKPMWTTRIGCLKGCLDYLGVDATDSWFFGASGHAFALNIHEELCPSGPTAWNTQAIDRLAGNVGVSIEGLGAHKSEPYFASTQEEIWKKICTAIDQGHPCFGWELEIPEFYVVKGYNQDSYIFIGHDGEEKTKPWKELGDTGIGVIEMGIVRPATAASDKKLVRDAFEYALEVSRNPEGWTGPLYDMGLAGYDLWIKALEERKAGGYGNSYNAQVWSECRRHAVGFLKEAKKRLDDEQLNPLFDEAISHYEKVAENLTKVAETYPFQGDDADYQMDDMAKRQPCVEALKTARTEEKAGLGALEKIVYQLSGEE